jgi:hypothetical protein
MAMASMPQAASVLGLELALVPGRVALQAWASMLVLAPLLVPMSVPSLALVSVPRSVPASVLAEMSAPVSLQGTAWVLARHLVLESAMTAVLRHSRHTKSQSNARNYLRMLHTSRQTEPTRTSSTCCKHSQGFQPTCNTQNYR